MIHLVYLSIALLLGFNELLNKLCGFNAKKIAYSSSH
jgi:hypothetical protein